MLDELHVGRAALVGLSAGTAVAVDFALAYPARVTRLVLASPSVNGFVPKESMEWMKPVFNFAAPDVFDKLLLEFLSGRWPRALV